jgi:hypothetical protein
VVHVDISHTLQRNTRLQSGRLMRVPVLSNIKPTEDYSTDLIARRQAKSMTTFDSSRDRIAEYVQAAGLVGAALLGIWLFFSRVLGGWHRHWARAHQSAPTPPALIAGAWVLAIAALLCFLAFKIIRVERKGLVFAARSVLLPSALLISGVGACFLCLLVAMPASAILDWMGPAPDAITIHVSEFVLTMTMACMVGVPMVLWRPAYVVDRIARTITHYRWNLASSWTRSLPYGFAIAWDKYDFLRPRAILHNTDFVKDYKGIKCSFVLEFCEGLTDIQCTQRAIIIAEYFDGETGKATAEQIAASLKAMGRD